MTTINVVPSTTDEGKFVAIVEHIPLSSYVSFQHGRIDTTVVGLVGSHARRMSFAEGYASPSAGDSAYKGGRTQSSGGVVTESKTIFAISNHVRVAVPDGTHYIKKSTKGTAEQADETTEAVSRDVLVVGANATCSSIVSVSKVGGSSCTIVARIFQEPEDVLPNGVPSKTSEEIALRGTYIGTATVTMVSIDKATRKSATIDDDKRKGLMSGLCENLIQSWEAADRASFKMLEETVMTATTAGNNHEGGGGKIADMILASGRIEVNVPLLMKAATNGKVKMEGAKEVTSPATVVLLESDKCTLRPSDFDFNGHLNMNMYVSFCIDSLRAALRRGQEQHLERVTKGTFETLPHTTGDEGLIAAPLGAALINAITFNNDCSASYKPIEDSPFRTLVSDIVIHQHRAKIAAASNNGNSEDAHVHVDQNATHRIPTIEELVLSRKVEYKREITDMNCTVETSIMSVLPLKDVVGSGDWRCSADTPWLLKFLVRSVPADGDQKKAFVAALCEMVIAPPPTAY